MSARTPWTLPLGHLFGVPLRMHPSFLLLIALLVPWVASRSPQPGRVVIVLLCVLASVVLHEVGHAVVARAYGVGAREIVLYPFGGITRLETPPRGASELAIALAGPAVNLALTVILTVVAVLTGGALAVDASQTATHSILVELSNWNLILFAVNLVPAFPLDGGHALRGLLSLGVSEEQATRITTSIGQALALMVALFAVLVPIGDVVLRLLLLMLAFVALAAANRERLVFRSRQRVRGHTARDAIMSRIETLAPQDSLERAARLLLATHQRDFPVVDAWGRVAGLLDRNSLMSGLRALGRDAAVLQAMDREHESVTSTTPLDEVVRRLQGGLRAVVVADDEALVGIVTLEKVSELLEVLERVENRPLGASQHK